MQTVARLDLDRLIDEIGRERSSEALAALYCAASGSVYAYSLSLLKNVHDAQDALHDCFVQIFLSAPGYVSAGKPMAWILTIARSKCMQMLRERKTRTDAPEESWEDLLGAAQAANVEDSLVIRECMLRLTQEERQIVLLHAVAGFRHREIAEFLQLPLPTALSKYSRAMRKLREYFGKERGQNEERYGQEDRKPDPRSLYECGS